MQLDETLDLLEASAISSSNFPGVRMSRKKRGALPACSKVGEQRQLLSVLLRAGDYERATTLRTVRRRVNDLATKARMSFLVDSSLCTRSGARRTPTARTREGSRSSSRAAQMTKSSTECRCLLEFHADDGRPSPSSTAPSPTRR